VLMAIRWEDSGAGGILARHRHAIVDGACGAPHGVAAAGSLVQARTSPCRSGSRTHSDQIEDQRATSRANESIPNRHHRVKTTPE